ncbi:hypothetical protein [Streptomyces antimicrobicus]|uniref:30S ribosomal protein S14 n=1 Tax=Streptomyces antimicrobicus TaxID=2883108 RepID=A0ABS8BD50_9ACTN|nr:hypothetical protein [Streptomyces antimicrobicus]MCB5182562.1 hypothetical protein [Streptomyces antimicrobicus]
MGEEMRTLPCRSCKKPLVQRSRWRRKRYCGPWHRVKYTVSKIVELVMEAGAA